ncbi:DUF1284 domain-containing protein [Candidatus Woesearchaeota archaeon]|nr:DUF1284 domain-containing protein [Candidatus Woesearchaeota archaeon]
MAKTITLRGHHLRILHSYATRMDNPARIKIKDELVLHAAVDDGHSKKHGYNIISVIKKVFQPKTKIKLTDTLDDICQTCNYKTRKSCKEFIPYDVSAASDDRATLHFYELKKSVYNSETLVKKVLKKGCYF